MLHYIVIYHVLVYYTILYYINEFALGIITHAPDACFDARLVDLQSISTKCTHTLRMIMNCAGEIIEPLRSLIEHLMETVVLHKAVTLINNNLQS